MIWISDLSRWSLFCLANLVMWLDHMIINQICDLDFWFDHVTIILSGEVSHVTIIRTKYYAWWHPKNGTVDTVDFSELCSDQQLSFFTLLDRASFPHYNNTKIIKFGWELFILWVISYGLSFSGFARFLEFRGTINDSFSSKYMYMRQHMCWGQHSTSYKAQCQWRAWNVNPC